MHVFPKITSERKSYNRELSQDKYCHIMSNDYFVNSRCFILTRRFQCSRTAQLLYHTHCAWLNLFIKRLKKCLQKLKVLSTMLISQSINYRSNVTECIQCIQGRRHGFESGGKFCERSEQKILFDPQTFWPVVDKILLRQLSQPNSYVCGVDISVKA